MFCSEPVSKLSTHSTLWPSSNRWAHRWEPINPAPPVTTILKGLNLQGKCSFKEEMNWTPLPGYHIHCWMPFLHPGMSMGHGTSALRPLLYVRIFAARILTHQTIWGYNGNKTCSAFTGKSM